MFVFKNNMLIQGGVETVSDAFIDYLIKHEHTVKLVVFSQNIEESKDETKLVNPFLKNNDKIDLYTVKESKFDFMKAVFKSFLNFEYIYPSDLPDKSIDAFKPDVIIAVGNPFLISNIKLALKKLNFNSKIVYWDHGFLFSFFLTSKNRLKNLIKFQIKKHIVNLSLRQSNGFLAISSGIKERILSFNEKYKHIYVVFNPIRQYDGPLIQRSEKPIFIYVGRISEQDKNISFMLKSMRKLKDENWYLKIIGTGPDESKLKNLSIRLGLSDKVEWLGFKKDPYENLDQGVTALLLTSRYEGFPMVLIEANQRGIPVISSDCKPGPVDIVIQGTNGYLYPEGDMDAFVKIVNDVIDGKLTFGTPEEIAKTAERLSEEKVCNNIIKALEDIIKA